jgi:hypothetical protein
MSLIHTLRVPRPSHAAVGSLLLRARPVVHVRDLSRRSRDGQFVISSCAAGTWIGCMGLMVELGGGEATVPCRGGRAAWQTWVPWWIMQRQRGRPSHACLRWSCMRPPTRYGKSSLFSVCSLPSGSHQPRAVCCELWRWSGRGSTGLAAAIEKWCPWCYAVRSGPRQLCAARWNRRKRREVATNGVRDAREIAVVVEEAAWASPEWAQRRRPGAGDAARRPWPAN